KGIIDTLADAVIDERVTSDDLSVHSASLAQSWHFQMQQLPGCCGVIVSFHQFICEALRNKGLGKRLQALKEAIARKLKFGLMLCTVTADNEAQVKVLTATGWKEIDNFINPHTQHKVLLFSKHID